MPEPACRLYLITPPAFDDLAAFGRALGRGAGGGRRRRPAASAEGRPRGGDRRGGGACAAAHRASPGRAADPQRPARPRREARLRRRAHRPGRTRPTPRRGSWSARTAWSASPATTAGTWPWRPPRRAPTMSPSAPSFPPRPRRPSPAPTSRSWRSGRRSMQTPCVAIGGITPANCRPLVAAGADFLAASVGVWRHPAGPARRWRRSTPRSRPAWGSALRPPAGRRGRTRPAPSRRTGGSTRCAGSRAQTR